MRVVTRVLGCGVALVLLLGGASAVAAQTAAEWDARRPQMTRPALEELLAQYEGVDGSSAYSEELKDRARYEADLIRARLRDGDFQTGDQIQLTVEGETALTNTFIVEPGPRLVLPVIGEVPLAGVLRSELEDHLRAHLGRYIVNPVVHARALIRISIFGSVGSPGFHVSPADAILTDVLNMAGGPAGNADLDKLRVERGGEKIWGEQVLQQAIIEGRTLDQLSMRAGDRIVVPQQGGGFQWQTVRLLVVGVPGAIYGIYRLIRLF